MKTKSAILTVVAAMVLLQTGIVSAQTRQGNRAPAPQPSQPVTTQTAITKDGRTVILKSDGTWVYSNEKSPENTSATVAPIKTEQTSTLSFETGLVMKSGDVKPVARGTFYLLDNNLENILRSSGFQASGGSPILATFALKYVSRQLELLRGSSSTVFDRAMESVKPHIVANTTTDFSGKGQFSSVAPGTYYLMHVSEIGRNVVLWNLKVDLKPGQNSVTLDQNNTAEAF